MIVRDPQSNLFIAICSGCGCRVHIDSDTGFGAASLATGAGWLLGMRDLCRECRPTPTVGDDASPKQARTRRN